MNLQIFWIEIKTQTQSTVLLLDQANFYIILFKCPNDTNYNHFKVYLFWIIIFCFCFCFVLDLFSNHIFVLFHLHDIYFDLKDYRFHMSNMHVFCSFCLCFVTFLNANQQFIPEKDENPVEIAFKCQSQCPMIKWTEWKWIGKRIGSLYMWAWRDH